MHVKLGGYHVGDIEVVAAIDVDRNKVGRDLAEAIYTEPNNTIRFADVPLTGVKVVRGMTHDGVGKYLRDIVVPSDEPTADIVQVLKDSGAQVVINYLPVGSEEATKWYVEQVLQAGCAFINCVPVFIASQSYWSDRFKKAGLPVIGDDIKSQVGATIVHRALASLFVDRGVRIDRTYQLNFGGNTDFLNMLERDRLESKKISKTGAVSSIIPYKLDAGNIHVGPSDHVPFLQDRKFCSIRIEGTTFGDVPLLVKAELEVWDSPNSAGVVIDAIRCARLALDRKLSGPIHPSSCYFFKTPPKQFEDSVCRAMVEDFIRD
jgi:myo-inositol-1-phosphate synthase